MWICHKDIPSKKVMTYAVLDDQSDTCFLTDGVCKELGINGPETVIELGTMHTVQDIKTQKISGLIISPEDESVDIPLPKSFSREQIPARRDQIPTADMARNWNHLRPIANEIPAYREDLDIGLLIGNNCVQAIKPRDVIPGKPRDPYAVRTVLGWGLIGATNQNHKHHNTDISNCHRIQTRDIASQDSPELNFISRKPNQWKYVESKLNPADGASRGLKASELINNATWVNGPEFLYEQHKDWGEYHQPSDLTKLLPDDVEVKKASVLTTSAKEMPSMVERLEYFSSLHRAKRAYAVCLRYRRLLLARIRKKGKPNNAEPEIQSNRKYIPVSVEEMELAEQYIVKLVQKQAFSKELSSLKQEKEDQNHSKSERKKRVVSKSSTLLRLDPFIDENGLIRVGGRIRNVSIDDKAKHPIVLPKKEYLSELVARQLHERVEHQGRGITMNEVRSSGYWIIGGKSVVAKLIKKCATCQRLRATVTDQKMANLPKERLEASPPFTYSAVDYFGPWYIKQGRKEMKRYGVLFTCMSSRAIHLEVSETLETDSFLNAYRRFVCRRGPIRQLRCDCVTNFVGASAELRKCLEEMNQEIIKAELLKENCDWFDFKFNTPKASHMGGVWERQIRTVRNVLNAILHKNGYQLNEESLRTFMCEAESIVNSRPLTVDNLSSPDCPEPLTPNHLLTMKSKIVLPPPGVFQTADMYLRKHWKRVQHLSNEFWTRWRKEFLHALQE